MVKLSLAERQHLEDIRNVLLRRLRVRETQLGLREQFLPPRQREHLLRPLIEVQEQALAQLEARLGAGTLEPGLAARFQEVHRSHLAVLHEMLSGARPYVPFPQLVELEDIRRQLARIEQQLQDDQVVG